MKPEGVTDVAYHLLEHLAWDRASHQGWAHFGFSSKEAGAGLFQASLLSEGRQTPGFNVCDLATEEQLSLSAARDSSQCPFSLAPRKTASPAPHGRIRIPLAESKFRSIWVLRKKKCHVHLETISAGPKPKQKKHDPKEGGWRSDI